MPKHPARRVRNRNRRLDDRLWTADGQEYRRVILAGGYFPDPALLSSALRGQQPLLGLLADHSAIEWVDGARAATLVHAATTDGSVSLDRRTYRPTLWSRAGEAPVLLFEEVH